MSNLSIIVLMNCAFFPLKSVLTFKIKRSATLTTAWISIAIYDFINFKFAVQCLPKPGGHGLRLRQTTRQHFRHNLYWGSSQVVLNRCVFLYQCFSSNTDFALFVRGMFSLFWLADIFAFRPQSSPVNVGYEGFNCIAKLLIYKYIIEQIKITHYPVTPWQTSIFYKWI